VRIGQPQVKQNDVNLVLRQMLLGIRQAFHVREIGLPQALVIQHLAQQKRIARIIFDQEKYLDGFRWHPLLTVTPLVRPLFPFDGSLKGLRPNEDELDIEVALPAALKSVVSTPDHSADVFDE
jgi:hypothetical protein